LGTPTRKSLPLNLLEPTKAKKRLLSEAYQRFFSIVKDALGYVGDVQSRAELHKKTYRVFRGRYAVASQLIVEATSYACSVRKTLEGGIRRCVVRFDKRTFSFKQT
jgi:hypothetical protein